MSPRPPQVTEPIDVHRPRARTTAGRTNPLVKKRVAAFGSVMAVLFGILVVRLWFLQVVGAQGFEERAEGNTIRTINIPAPRGRIFDRNGVELAGTREAWDIVALPQDLEDEKGRLTEQGSETLGRIARAIGEPKAALRRLMVVSKKKTPSKSVVFKADIDDALRIPLTERIAQFPGIRIEKVFRRNYEQRSSLGHVLGWVGPITKETIDEKLRQGYRHDAIVGQGGLESRYEQYLKGEDGEKQVEVDGSGQPVPGGRGTERPARPGLDLKTTIDITVQQALEDALAEKAEFHASLKDGGGAGGVVINAETGEVVALASYPPLDPRVFSRGRPAEIRAVTRNRRKPQLNRALSAYPPASTFKAVTAIAALQTGTLQPTDFLTSKKSVTLFSTVFKNFRDLEQPDMQVDRALGVSSDTFFYQVGASLYTQASKANREAGNNQLSEWAKYLGLGRITGIDIPGETAGIVPDRRYKESVIPKATDRNYNRWVPGDTINMSVGQGLLLSTPLQMARGYAALVNTRHAVLQPIVGKEVVDADTDQLVVDLQRGRPETLLPEFKDGVLQPVLNGLSWATSNSEGTASPSFGRLGGLVAGKTGTAQSGRDRDHAWFVGYGPTSDSADPRSRYVVAIVVEYAGLGGEVAAPAACKALAPALGYDAALCGSGRRPPQTAAGD